MFRLQQFFTASLWLSSLYPLAQAQNLNPTGAGCIDSSGFLECYATQQNTADTCVTSFCSQYQGDSNEYENCVLGCAWAQLGSNIGCWIQSCWNMIYSCQYQGTCIQYLNNVEGGLINLDLPFYPPPENAVASCSCNIGEVYGNITSVDIDNAIVCDNFVGDSQEYLANCQCCQASQILSNVFDLCPSSDLGYIMNVAAEIQEYKNIASYSPDQCAILNTNPSVCESIYGFSILGNKKWLNPFKLPGGGIPGTQALSNLPGTITAITPATFTLELFPAVTTTIIPVHNPSH